MVLLRLAMISCTGKAGGDQPRPADTDGGASRSLHGTSPHGNTNVCNANLAQKRIGGKLEETVKRLDILGTGNVRIPASLDLPFEKQLRQATHKVRNTLSLLPFPDRVLSSGCLPVLPPD